MGACCCGWQTAQQVLRNAEDQKGKVAIVTGPTAGIGLETSAVLASIGIHVILAGRNRDKLEVAARAVESRSVDAKVTALQLDLSSQKSIRTFVEEFSRLKLPLHYLINNAGIMATPYSRTAEGYESQFGTNHLGHFLLTNLLLPKLQACAPTPTRIITVASLACNSHKITDQTDPVQFNLDEKNYDPFGAYGNSKLANVLHMYELARRLHGTNVTCFAVHPGVVASELGRSSCLLRCVLSSPCAKSVSQGAATSVYLTVTPGVEQYSGAFFNNCQPQGPGCCTCCSPKPIIRNGDLAQRLWDMSEKITRD